MRFGLAVLTLAALTPGFADTLQLRNGKTVRGTYLGGNSRQVRMEVGDRVEAFEVSDITSLQFDSEAAAPAPAPPRPRNVERDSEPRVLRPSPSAAAAQPARSSGLTLPQGAAITVRMIDAIDSETNRIGQTFQASVDEPVLVDGETVIPRGADAVVKLAEDKQSGKLSGRTELGLVLMSVKVDGRMVDVTSEEYTKASESRTAKTGKMAGGGAVLGAIIGGIAGGGKGAAVGAAAGAGAGAATQVATKGQRVRIPSETRLTFSLQYPVKL
ncbi:MAG: hypothetical protein HY013_13175 [Candidatus Solibacter usitatus]|nr:hypothetical protein [Candidatus Solibacter usitatus]